MDPRTNPYAPGAGARPPEFAGREALIEDADIAFDRVLNGLHVDHILLLGQRGVGKTVLLNDLHGTAKAKGIETVRLEVPDARGGHLVRALVPGLNVVLRKLDRRQKAEEYLRLAGAALQNFAAMFKVKYEGFSVGATPASPAADTGVLEQDLPELIGLVAQAAAARKTALGLFIDEIQYLSRTELSALARAVHATAQDGHPFLLVGAGLPQMAALVGEAKSYAERLFGIRQIGALPGEAARQVLTEPAARFDVEFTEDALDLILAQTEGYPYFLQTWGKFAWEQATGSPITAQDVIDAGPDIRLYLDQSFFRIRYDRCTEAEQHYLRGMAELGPGPHRSGDISAALGTTSDKLAPVRKSLIDMGMIYSQRHGETAFTVPLFDEFMKRMQPDLTPWKPRKRRKR